MIDKITEFLTNKIRKEMPDVDNERAEVINYGLQILIGEVPKFFIMLFMVKNPITTQRFPRGNCLIVSI